MRDFDGREANMFFKFSFHSAGAIAASVLVTAILSPVDVVAQTASTAGASQLTEPKDSSIVAYKPALGIYQHYVDEPVAPWLASNQRVMQAGGWRAYAKQAQDDAPATTPAKEKP